MEKSYFIIIAMILLISSVFALKVDIPKPSVTDISNESVNSSNYWNTSAGAFSGINTTQFENDGGLLHAVQSWWDGLYCKLTGCTMTGAITMGGNNIINAGNITSSGSTHRLDVTTGNQTLTLDSGGIAYSCLELLESGAYGFRICNDGAGSNRLVISSFEDGYEWMWIDRDEGTINFLNDTIFTTVNVTTINTEGNVTADYFFGNGSQLTDVPGTLYYSDEVWINKNSSNAFNFNESKLATTYYNATQSLAVVGTIDGGTIVDTQHPDGDYDGITFNFSEASGGPGLDLRINFTGVPNFNKGYMRYKTNSLSGDYPLVQLWSYDDLEWEGGYGYVSESSNDFFPLQNDVLDSSSHLQDGVVQMRLYKEANGNTQNEYYVDMLAIVDGYATPSGNVDLTPYWRYDDNDEDRNFSTTGLINGINISNLSNNYWDSLDTPDDISTMLYFYNKTDIDDALNLKYNSSNPYNFYNDTTLDLSGYFILANENNVTNLTYMTEIMADGQIRTKGNKIVGGDIASKSLGSGVGFKESVKLKTGYNAISFAFNLTDNLDFTDRVIPVYSTDNLLGYSSPISYNIRKIKFTNDTGSCYYGETGCAITNLRLAKPKGINASAYNKIDKLSINDAFWLTSSSNGNITFEGVGGTPVGQTYAWADIRVDNGQGERAITDIVADGSDWLFRLSGEKEFYYYDGVALRTVCDSVMDCYRIFLNPWEGILVYSNVNNLVLITDNSTYGGYLAGTDGYFKNLYGDGSQLTGISGGNESFNQTLTDELYAIFGYGDDWNKTYADTLYADISVTGGNPFNQSLNTTDEVTFDNVTTTQYITAEGGFRSLPNNSSIIINNSGLNNIPILQGYKPDGTPTWVALKNGLWQMTEGTTMYTYWRDLFSVAESYMLWTPATKNLDFTGFGDISFGSTSAISILKTLTVSQLATFNGGISSTKRIKGYNGLIVTGNETNITSGASLPVYITGGVGGDETLGGELADNIQGNQYSGTNWAYRGYPNLDVIHTTTNNNALAESSSAFSPTIGLKYKITINLSGTVGTTYATFGGDTSAGLGATNTFYVTANTTDAIQIYSNGNGCVVDSVSIKEVTAPPTHGFDVILSGGLSGGDGSGEKGKVKLNSGMNVSLNNLTNINYGCFDEACAVYVRYNGTCIVSSNDAEANCI